MLFHKKAAAAAYDAATQQPVLKCSICTGEQVAGFKDKGTGKIEEVMLIRTERDLDAFRAKYGIPPECPIAKEY